MEAVTLTIPDGLDGEPLELYFSGSQTYTVPSGKNLYIGYMTGSYGIAINGVQIGSNVYNNGNNIICNEGDVLTSSAWVQILPLFTVC